MAELIVGLQGSGKSYRASYLMYHDGHKYDKIFTNIDGIKTTDKIKPIEFKKFVNETLDDIYTQQVLMDGTFEESIKMFQSKGILPEDVSSENRVLIVVDEAQNYFGKSVKLEASLVWFITQHRHLYIELYLITQAHTLLRSDYHLFNLVYRAYPPAKQVIKSRIKYVEYAGLPMNTDNETKRFSLPKEQRVFDLYESGDKVDSPNILKKFIWYFVMIIALIVGSLFYFLSNFGNADKAEKRTSTVVNNISSTAPYDSNAIKILEPKVILKKKLLTFVIWRDDAEFYIQDIADDTSFPIEFLTYLKDEYFLKVIKKERDNFRTLIYVICDLEIRNFLEDTQERKLTDFGASDIAI